MDGFRRMAQTLGEVGNELEERVNLMMDTYVTVYWTHGCAILDVHAMMEYPASPFQHHLLRTIAATLCSKEKAAGGKQFLELASALKRSLTLGSGRWRLPLTAGLAWTLVVNKGESPKLLVHTTVVKRSALSTSVPLGEWVQWNGRWRVRAQVGCIDAAAKEGFDLSNGICVRGIDDCMWRELVSMDRGAFKGHLRGLGMPFEVKRCVPVFTDVHGQVIAVPQLGIRRTTSAQVQSLFWPV